MGAGFLLFGAVTVAALRAQRTTDPFLRRPQ
jgi:hypothetical protein